MKISDLIKQLNAIKKVHGDLSCGLLNGVSGNFSSIQSLTLVHPLRKDGCYDHTQKPWGVRVDDFKQP